MASEPLSVFLTLVLIKWKPCQLSFLAVLAICAEKSSSCSLQGSYCVPMYILHELSVILPS